MFRAEKVLLGQVLLLDKTVPQFWEAVLDLGAVHIEDKFQISPDMIPPKYVLEEEKAKIDLLESRIEAICRLLDINYDYLTKGELYSFVEQVSVSPSEISESISSDLDKIEANITEVISLIEKRKQFIFDNNQLSWFVSLLMHAGLDSLFELNRDLLPFWIGSIPKENLSHLFESLSEATIVVETENISRNRIAIFLMALPKDKESVEDALSAGGFIPAPINTLDPTLSLSELEDNLEFAIWEAREEISQLQEMLKKKRNVFKELLSKLAKQLKLEKKLIMAMGACKGTQYIVLVNMWIKQRDKAKIESILKEKMSSLVYIEWMEVDEVDIPANQVPAAFRLNGVMKSFFELVKGYGYPAFNEINPIAVFTFGFIFMYGMMFADLGHGLVLALLGWFLRGKNKHFSDIFVWVGVSSMIWGFIFGSVFGREDIIKPLWVSPLHNPLPPMIFSIVFGVIYICIGICFYILNAIINKDKHEALFGEWGIFSLFTYFALLSAILMHNLPVVVRIILIGLPLVIMVSGAIKYDKHADRAEILFRPVEIILSLFANTVSFVRLAAFALNHCALMIVVFVIADLLKVLPLKGIVLISGNVFVILMEALLVMIQCLRLNYYEFFSKFYHGNGREFIPLRWDS